MVDPGYLRRAKTIYEGRVIPFEMPPERCTDIDTPFDFRLVDWMMGERLKGEHHG